jgi:hypothetical protein
MAKRKRIKYADDIEGYEVRHTDCCYRCEHSATDYDGISMCTLVNVEVDHLGWCPKFERRRG